MRWLLTLVQNSMWQGSMEWNRKFQIMRKEGQGSVGTTKSSKDRDTTTDIEETNGQKRLREWFVIVNQTRWCIVSSIWNFVKKVWEKFESWYMSKTLRNKLFPKEQLYCLNIQEECDLLQLKFSNSKLKFLLNENLTRWIFKRSMICSRLKFSNINNLNIMSGA